MDKIKFIKKTQKKMRKILCNGSCDSCCPFLNSYTDIKGERHFCPYTMLSNVAYKINEKK